jgi:hypothetical protein
MQKKKRKFSRVADQIHIARSDSGFTVSKLAEQAKVSRPWIGPLQGSKWLLSGCNADGKVYVNSITFTLEGLHFSVGNDCERGKSRSQRGFAVAH